MATDEMIESSRAFSRWFGDNLNGIDEIKLWNLFLEKDREFQEKQSKLLNSEKKGTLIDAWNVFWESILEWGITILLYILGGAFICTGSLTIGAAFAFISYSGYVTGPVSALLNLKMYFARIIPSAKRLFQFLDMEVEEDTGTKILEKNLPKIEFKNVGFSYDKARCILKDVNFFANSGEKIAIIGQNGSGKTTILNLLLRFYEPDQGAILVDGIDIREIQLKDLRDLFAVVSQDPYLFLGGIEENAFQALLMAVKLGKDIICFLPLNDDEKEVIRKMCECFGGMCQFIKPLTPSHVDKDAKVQLYNFHVPVIYISEMYTNCGGYEALIRIAEAIRCKGYKPLVLSNNPYNILLKYHSINFNDVTSLENSVVEINQAVYLLSCKVNPDIIIVHLPNPVMQYNRQNRFDCGVLSHVISQAVPGNGYLYCSLKTKDFRFLKAITDTIEKKLDCPLIGVWIGNQILDPASSSGTSLVNLPADNISIQSQTDSLSIYNAYSIIDQNSLVSCIIDNFLNLSYGVI